MDFQDYQSGAKESFFWFEKKKHLIKVLIEKIIKPGYKLRILDVGSGTGTNIPMLKQFGDVYVIDNDENALKLVSNNLIKEKMFADATRIPYSENFFDIVVITDVLEHVEDDRAAVREIKRVLKQNGFLIFTVPAFNALLSGHDHALGHFRRYSKKSLRTLLTDFKEIDTAFWMFFLFLPVALGKLLNRKNKQIHPFGIPRTLNVCLGYVLDVENWLIKHSCHLPIGISLYGIYKKQ